VQILRRERARLEEFSNEKKTAAAIITPHP
jgi:hypothetical protein